MKILSVTLPHWYAENCTKYTSALTQYPMLPKWFVRFLMRHKLFYWINEFPRGEIKWQ
jgi:hypothetical protein